MSILAVCLGQRRPLEREPCRDRLAGRGGWTPTVSVASLSVIGGCSGASRRLLQCARPSSLLACQRTNAGLVRSTLLCPTQFMLPDNLRNRMRGSVAQRAAALLALALCLAGAAGGAVAHASSAV